MSDSQEPDTNVPNDFAALRVADFGEKVQTFLFGCAIWLGSADKSLSVGEQRWLRAEFGNAYAGLLQASLKFQGKALPPYVNKCFAALDDSEREALLPKLKPWLQALALSDSVFADEERDVLDQILKQLQAP
jgi:hypothetical protein